MSDTVKLRRGHIEVQNSGDTRQARPGGALWRIEADGKGYVEVWREGVYRGAGKIRNKKIGMHYKLTIGKVGRQKRFDADPEFVLGELRRHSLVKGPHSSALKLQIDGTGKATYESDMTIHTLIESLVLDEARFNVKFSDDWNAGQTGQYVVLLRHMREESNYDDTDQVEYDKEKHRVQADQVQKRIERFLKEAGFRNLEHGYDWSAWGEKKEIEINIQDKRPYDTSHHDYAPFDRGSSGNRDLFQEVQITITRQDRKALTASDFEFIWDIVTDIGPNRSDAEREIAKWIHKAA